MSEIEKLEKELETLEKERNIFRSNIIRRYESFNIKGYEEEKEQLADRITKTEFQDKIFRLKNRILRLKTKRFFRIKDSEGNILFETDKNIYDLLIEAQFCDSDFYGENQIYDLIHNVNDKLSDILHNHENYDYYE